MHRDKPCEPVIEPHMTILDVVSRYRGTESVFSRYDEQAGTCLCCQALFETLEQVASLYGLDLERLTADLRSAASRDPGPDRPKETGS